MKQFIGLLAMMALLFLAIFIFIRVLSLLFRRKRKEAGGGVFHQREMHDELADAAEDVAGASRIAAAVASAAVFFVAPAGLMALATGLGLIPKPLIMTLLPVLVVIAAGAAAVSAAAKLYAKKKKKNRTDSGRPTV